VTTDELLRSLQTLSRATVFRDIAALGIKPLGFPKQRPQQWPANAAQLILERRGLAVTTTATPDKGKTQLASLAALRSERRKAKQSPRR